uniref:Growth hormone releasing hormone receptor 2 n=1 Tax=Lates calcarifer TaxID=8187 RepID=A0A4W6E6J0_LATCA
MEFSLTAAVCLLIITRYTVSCQVNSTHPECAIILHLQKKENECKVEMETSAAASLLSSNNKNAGCGMEWDGVSCWPAASEGDIISVHCPLPLLKPETPPALITRNCTVQGWSKPNLPYYKACYYEAYEQDEDKNYFDALKMMYSVGYGVSLGCSPHRCCGFLKLLCTRNYIHLNLFVSFMLRSLAVFIKDAVLFADKSMDHCTVSTLQCKAAVTFFHFCVLSNFSWLLVEGLYLQSLLLFAFTQTRKLFWIYAVIGWGTPLKIKIYLLENIQDGRLVHSTLLLIPLFGVHYVVFALFPEHIGVGPRLYLELVLGSFQYVFISACFV